MDKTPRTHINGISFFSARHDFDAASRSNLDGLTHLKVNHSFSTQVIDEGTHTIPAHFGDRAVTIAVIHKPDSVWMLFQHILPGPEIFGIRCTDKAVGTDSKMTIADTCDEVSIERDLRGWVGQKYKVITRSMPLCQSTPG